MERIDYLPLGTIVYLRSGMKKMIIITRGVVIANNDEVEFYDYGAVPYPEGIQSDQILYFQHDWIKKVVFTGYSDQDDEMAVDIINEFLKDHPEIPRGFIPGSLEELHDEEE